MKIPVHITIIGGGTMGETITASLLQSGTVERRFITVVDVRKDRLVALRHRYHVQTTNSFVNAVPGATIVILAVKPQEAKFVMEEIAPYLASHALVISIMAGVPLAKMRKRLKRRQIIRSMPNTPAQIREGMTVWVATDEVTNAQKKIARRIFSSFGKQLEVKRENLIDAATAVSGSGPAYLFACAEYLINAAKKLGLSRKQAEIMVKQTVRGAALLMDQSKDAPETLGKKVASKKGTTDAALRVFQSERVASRLEKGIRAAYQRAKELAKLFG